MQTNFIHEDLQIRLRQLEQDIAEAKRMEQSRRGDHSFFETLIEAAPLGIARITQDGEILFANQSLSHAFGFGSPEELMTSVQNFADLTVSSSHGFELVEKLRAETP